MNHFTKKNLFALLAGVCFLFALCAGLLFVSGERQGAAGTAGTAYAEEGTASALRFMLFNDNAEYKVSVSDKSVKEVKIPAYYNGLPVTEVADNAFISCASLERAEIPATVKRVGNNAFYNCRALKRVVGMANVTVIGNNAFAMCAALENLIIPPKVNSMGSYVIRNVTNPVYVRSTKEAFNALNANWNRNSTAQIIYGNDLVCDPIYEEEGRIKGYEITAAQNLMETEDYELLCSYRYRECNGAECKDEECANQHTERYYPILEFAQNAFENSFFHSLTVKYDEAHIPERFPVNINSKAFYVVMADSIDIQVDITLNDDLNDDSLYSEWEKGKSVNVFAYSTITSITLPDSLTDIPRYSFAGCASLRHINNSNSEIAANTLSDNITVIGDNAFQECTALEVLNIPATVEHIGDNAFAFWGSWEAEQTIKIDLYKAGEQWDKNWKGSLGTNASVQFNTMSVLFERQEGEGGSDGAEVTYGDPMPAATAPERIGYTFLGYYTAPGGQGEQYYDGDMASAQNWNIITDEVTTLYAHWSANVYTVLLKDGVTVQAVFGEAMPAAPKPATEKGYTFRGYYAPNGRMYYDGKMESVRVWDIAEDNVQLRATMTPIDYKIVLNDNVIVYARYGEEMPPAPAPAHVPGRIFTGYSYNGTLYYNADMTSAHVWDLEHGAQLVFESVELVTHITYDLDGGVNASGNPETLKYSETVVLQAPEKRGYCFDGWYLNGKKVINLIEIDAENITLTARWIGRFVQVYQGDYRFNVSKLPYVIFELPESLRYNCTFNIAADVQQVYIYSPYKNKTYNINIEIENRTTDFNLLLENVTITAGTLEYKQIPTISMESSNNSALNLYTYGNVVIRGATGYEEQYGKGYEGGVAVQCNTLCFRYAETLYIYGGDGGQGYRDYESGNGGNAIVVERDLIMPSGHSIIIVGGSNFELQMSAIPIIIKSGNDIIFY